jgi:hypothetical protein
VDTIERVIDSGRFYFQRLCLACPVWVDLEVLLPYQGSSSYSPKDDDLILSGEVPGTLREWVRSDQGVCGLGSLGSR